MARTAALEKAFPRQEGSDIVRKDDPWLRQLAESRIDNPKEVKEEHRRIRQAEIVSTAEEEKRRQEGLDAEEDDEDALEERRKRIREKLLQRQQEEAAALLPEDEVDEVEEEEEFEESEYETDSEEETMGIAMVKPVFVPKLERDTIAERDRLEAEERRLEEAVKRRIEERRQETKQIVGMKIKEEHEIQKNMELDANIVDVDTGDDVNEAEEYKA